MNRLQVAAAIACLTGSALAQTPPAPPACNAPVHRQFDFWVGEWEVTGGPKLDALVGHSSIARVADGCALSEHWINSKGQDGRSLNAYDGVAKQWTQFWVGFDGVILRLVGGIDDGAMLMQGELPGANGGVQKQRIRWTPGDDGSVEQKWETSDDDGKTWQVSFIGIYRRADAKGDDAKL
jgi:hypothetical protein